MVSFDPVPSRKFLWGHVVWFGSWLFVTIVAIGLSPSSNHHGTHQQLGLPPCPSVIMWGRPCPGCGLTTSFSATVHGQLGLAWAAHPFGTVLYALWGVSAMCCLIGFIRLRRFNTDSRAMSFALAGLALAFFGYGAWRFNSIRAYAMPEPSVWSSR